MDAQQHQRPQRKASWGRVLIISIVLFFVIVSAVLWLIWSPGQWNSILPGLIITVLGIVIALFQWLFPIASDASADRVHHHSEQQQPHPPVLPMHGPDTQPLTGPLSPVLPLSNSTYRNLVAVPPPTDARTIQQREKSVKEIYAQLVHADVAAVVLTGIGGVGKSTLAALVFRYAEELQAADNGPFEEHSLWLKVDSSAVTMNDLIGTIFEALGRPLPDLDKLAPHNQVATLFNALNTVNYPRLIVLDQFENLLDWQTGYALPDRVGVGEWIDAMNSQPCACRILLTSRPWPLGTRSYPPTYMQEYPVKGLEEQEGVDLLCKLGIQASKEELQLAAQRSGGHAFALTLLASLLRNRHLSLKVFFAESAYAQLWSGNVARNLLNQIYTEQLDVVQRRLLIAFCVYREPVPLEAARAVVDPERTVPGIRWQLALDALLAQHLLQPAGEGLYQLHTIVVGFANDHFDEQDEVANEREFRRAYGRAAQYYCRYAAHYCPPYGKRKSIGDVHALVEATWALCQAEKWQDAYALMEQENLSVDLRRWGNSGMLLELYQLLLPLQKWQPEEITAAHIYNELGEVCRILGQVEQGRKYFEQALDLSREAKEPREEGRALSNIGRTYNDTINKQQALIYYEEALNVYKKADDLAGRSVVLRNIGWAYYDLALMDKARAAFEEALQLDRQLGARGDEARTLNSIGRVHLNVGELPEALEYHELALHLASEAGDRGIKATALNCLGRTYEAMGSRKALDDTSKASEYRLKAIVYYEEALAIRREIGNRSSESSALNNLGVVYYRLGELARALQYYEEALVVRREVGNRSGEAKTQALMGWVYRDMGQVERAIEHFKLALAIRREMGQRKHEAKTLSVLGLSYSEAHRYDLAIACLLLSLELFAQLQDLDPDAIERARKTQMYLSDIEEKLSAEQFEQLKARVEHQARQLVEQALT